MSYSVPSSKDGMAFSSMMPNSIAFSPATTTSSSFPDDNSDEAANVERFGNLRSPAPKPTDSPFKDREGMLSAFCK
uniref:Uncharacterized protein n=1 Tax=Steinernema glaseri TaxID=37863 RepID=A0A1I7Y2G7_9BILA